MALTKGSDFKYKKRSADAVKARAEQDGGAFDSILKSGTDTFRPKQGLNTVRFLPPTWEDPQHYGFDVWVHQYVGADSGSYICPKKMKNEDCPICAAQTEANEAGEEDEAKQLKAVKKVAAYIIDRDDKKPIPKIWLMSWTMDRDISTLCHSEKTGKTLLLDDPDNGYDVSFKRTGQQLNTRYLGMQVDRDDSALLDTQKEVNTLMKKVEDNPIPDLLLYRSEEYLEGVVNGKSSKKDPDEEDEEKPARRRRSEPEEEEDDDEKPSRRRRAEPEEEEEEKPSRRRRSEPEEEEDKKPSRRRRSEPEPEPEEEEEEEKPTRRRRSEPEEKEEEKPSRRRRAEPEEEEEEEKPTRRRRAEPEEEEEEDEKSTRRKRAEPEEEEEEKPTRRRRAEPEPEEEEEEERPTRRRR